MATYTWTNGAYIKAEAQAVGERLHELQRDNGEALTPRVVLEDARPVESPLHSCFEWDDTRAAELFREDQARHVIRCIRVVKGEGDQKQLQRVFVNVVETIDEEEQHRYVPMSRVLSDAELFRQVCARAAADLRSFEDRYAQFTNLASIGREARERVTQLTLEQAATV